MSITALNTALLNHCLDAAEGILVDCRSQDGAIRKSDAGIGAGSITATSLQGCDAPIISLLGRQAVAALRILSSPPTAAGASPSPAVLTARRLDDLIELAHARFYAHIPSHVPVCWRQLYTDASILKFALAYGEKGSFDLDGNIDSLVQPLDMALILAGGAGPPSRGSSWIHAALELLHSMLDVNKATRSMEDRRRPAKRPRLMSSPRGDFSSGPMFSDGGTAASHFVPPVRHPVRRSGPLGLEGFQAYLDQARHDTPKKGPQPLVMSGLIENWPARRADARPWASPDYLRWRTLRGKRLVPVEIGRSYVDAGWRQEIVKFERVLQALQAGSHTPQTASSSTVYLAQHALFTQIPRLRDDICIPDACYSVNNVHDADAHGATEGQEPMLNAWLGPAGTITPLHTDPHHNLLAQVVGRKYVRLYCPEQSAGLRPRGREGGVEMGNTSAVDVGVMEGWDIGSDETGSDGQTKTTDREQFLALPYMDCILEPGDTLYIPRGWWHYVRGLSVSFSVSFWWD